MSVQALTATFEHSRSTGSARLVLLSMANHAGDEGTAYISIATCTKEARISERAARYAVRQLESLGEIEAVGVHPQYRTVVYAIRVGQLLQGQILHPAKQAADSAPESKATKAVGVTALRSSSSSTGQSSARFTDSDFEAFWTAYPAKKGKAAAKRVFGKALAKAPLHTLIDAAERYRDDPHRDPKATKYAQGWLNDERWNDEDTEDSGSQALRLLRERGTA